MHRARIKGVRSRFGRLGKVATGVITPTESTVTTIDDALASPVRRNPRGPFALKSQ